ncbi:lipopolysaccharide assembly protein LapA domain-containing protein [Geminocystis sp. NIES-3709]|uniref:lipopolysaccharide assembly protein LapA domain-containing protein n=1 Tax=Geminocystis sp. NIES-3709 TaxID=1617448 RepID=UPI0005FC4C6F|nr:lipopolysaccharide assembly protein LapA domain-containing protein [Geminocystis sp. NIES-3709]BAQ65382.1 hypothetical protein GM3709_2147 [Geminocystis sp. NIES-3709]
MDRTKQIIISLIVGFWLILIAVFSIQNIELISLKFFFFESIKISIGVLLTFALAGGFFLGSIIPILFNNNNSYPRNKIQSKVKKSKKNEFKRDWEEEKDPLFDWD